MASDVEQVDLDRDGIDAQAVALLDADAPACFVWYRSARTGVKSSSHRMRRSGERTKSVLQKLLKRNVKFVIAAKKQIDRGDSRFTTGVRRNVARMSSIAAGLRARPRPSLAARMIALVSPVHRSPREESSHVR
jgi:hypothetical protein